MGFTEKELKRIMAVLKKKAPIPGKCSICGHDNWEVGDGFVSLVIQEDVKKRVLSGRSLLLLPVMCENCGNTHFINLLALGLLDVLEKTQATPKKEQEGEG